MDETSASKSIAHQIGGVQNDALRFGLHGVKSDIVGSHPLQSSLESVNSYNTLLPQQRALILALITKNCNWETMSLGRIIGNVLQLGFQPVPTLLLLAEIA